MLVLNPFVPTQFVNGSAPAINSTRLNYLGNGVKYVTDATIELQSLVQALMPVGAIIMFSGAVIPDGWALCNGTQGTPNLIDRFVLGGNGGDTGATGGSADAVVVSHSHTGSIGNHSASGSIGMTSAGGEGLADASASGVFTATTKTSKSVLFDSGSWAGKSSAYNFSLTHNHTVTVNSAGVSGAGKNMPPYYKLAFIMKLA